MPPVKNANASAATAALAPEVLAQVEPAPVGHRALGDHHQQAQDRQQQEPAAGQREARGLLALGRRAGTDPRACDNSTIASSSPEAIATDDARVDAGGGEPRREAGADHRRRTTSPRAART